MNFSMGKFRYILLLISCLLTAGLSLPAQSVSKTIFKGIVTDSKTKDPIPYVTIVVDGTTEGVSSDSQGKFLLLTNSPSPVLKVSHMGYKPEVLKITTGPSAYITIVLNPTSTSLSEIVIKAERIKYRNKGNPAVSIIDSIIKYKDKNRYEGFDFLQYEKYEKVQFAFSNISPKLKKSKILGKIRFIFENMDTTMKPGKEILPIYIKETISDYYYRREPRAINEVVKANKMVNIEEYLNNEGMAGYIDHLYEDIDIYDNSIMFLTNQFISPIAKTAPVFYRYFIIDTVNIESRKCIRLFFTPRNKTDMLFQGYLFVTMDGTYAVKKLDMAVNAKINLDWVQDTKIVQEFENYKKEGWVLTKDELAIDFGANKTGLGIYGQRSVSYKNYSINKEISDNDFRKKSPHIDSVPQTDMYWVQNRHQQLSKPEQGIYTTIDTLKRAPTFIRIMNFSRLVIASHHDLGPVVIGPVSTFYSFNAIEGSRVRLGGWTSPDFSKKIKMDGYVAYGFKDNKIKYNLGVAYSFSERSIPDFPVRSIKVNYQSDTKVPGQELHFVHEGSAFLSLKRGVDDKIFYHKTLKIDYLHEFLNHFSYNIGYSFSRLSPGGTLNFNKTNYLSAINNIPYINIAEAGLTLRYAPNEEFYPKKQFRSPIPNLYPIFQLKYFYGSKFLGNDYNYHNLRVNISKRFYPSVLGYTSVIFEAGKVFGKVPYPLLIIHNANQSYIYQATSYNLMNFLEFVSDQYVTLNMDHCFNGFLFNKIPLFNRLGLRENITFKILYGSLSKHNNPDLQPDLFKFPTDISGNPTTFSLGNAPYIEVSVGISNIFNVLRVDLVRRLSYMDNPNVSKYGIRMRFKFDL